MPSNPWNEATATGHQSKQRCVGCPMHTHCSRRSQPASCWFWQPRAGERSWHALHTSVSSSCIALQFDWRQTHHRAEITCVTMAFSVPCSSTRRSLYRRLTGGDADVLDDVPPRQLAAEDSCVAASTGPLVHIRPHRRHVHPVLHARAGGQDGTAIAGTISCSPRRAVLQYFVSDMDKCIEVQVVFCPVNSLPGLRSTWNGAGRS